ncbi:MULTISPECIES: hypothetical protein [unclassified Saccharothrix]|uniref:hypothetical protein n=1 Tax=unclassified Saccharothrix TaxID=2593673 RepID=UPI00307ED1BD
MDDFGPDDFGRDGTQAPPPPRFFPDPLAGLVTGADRVFPDALSGSAALEPAPAPPAPAAAESVGSGEGAASGPRLHDPTGYRQSGVPSDRVRRAPAARRAPTRPVQQGWNAPHAPAPSPYAYPTAQAPVPNAPTQYVPPHAPLASRAVPHAPLPSRAAPHQPRPVQTPQKTGVGWVGCLVLLAVLSGLLFPVARAIIEMVVRFFS